MNHGVAEKGNNMNHREAETQSINKMELNNISGQILDAAIEVYRNLGPGLLESVYEECLVYELNTRNIFVERQKLIPITYKNKILSKNFIIDIFVSNEIIVELKTVDKLLPIHEAQLLTYLKLCNKKLGILINFNEVLLKNGYKRLLNGQLPDL
jgi:GxxExxY protein